jgi:hypothetical protein
VYHVDVASFATGFPPGMSVPPVLPALGRWLAERPYGSVGYFNTFASEPSDVYVTPLEDASLAVRERVGIFLTLPEGSQLALWDHGGQAPAVVNIDSEGEYRTLADSLEAFLLGWGDRHCGVWELDRDDEDDDEDDEEDREPSRHADLAAWLRTQGLVVPDVPPAPDFGDWIEEVTERTERDRAARIAALPPIVPADPALTAAAARTIAATAEPMLGRFTDEPEIVAYCASLGIDLRTVPGPDEFRSLARFDAGFELEFAYPWEYRNQTLKARYTPDLRAEFEDARRRMLWSVTMHKAWAPPGLGRAHPRDSRFRAFDGPLPWGVTFGDTRESLAARLGPPVTDVGARQHWLTPDRSRALLVHYDGDTVGSVRIGIPPN